MPLQTSDNRFGNHGMMNSKPPHQPSRPNRVNFERPSETMDITTLMIRNVPRRYTEDAFVHEINKMAAPCDYNFLYLPWDTRKSANMGFAFVNFVSAEIAANVSQKHNGAPWGLVNANKRIVMMPAHLQGLVDNLAHYMGTVVALQGHMHAPRVFVNGVSIPFQEALHRFFPREIPQESELISSKCMQAEQGSRCIISGSAKSSVSTPGTPSPNSGNSFLDEDSQDTFNSRTDHGMAEIVRLRDRCKEFAILGQGCALQSNSLTTHQTEQASVYPKLHLRRDPPQPSIPVNAVEVRSSPGYHKAWMQTTQQLAILCNAGVFQALQWENGLQVFLNIQSESYT